MGMIETLTNAITKHGVDAITFPDGETVVLADLLVALGGAHSVAARGSQCGVHRFANMESKGCISCAYSKARAIVEAVAKVRPLVDEDGRGGGVCPLCDKPTEAPGTDPRQHAPDCAWVAARAMCEAAE